MKLNRQAIDVNQINDWIIDLQGTGRFELNAIVNDLMLLRQVSSMKVFDQQTVIATMRQLKFRVQRVIETPKGLMPAQIDALNEIQEYIASAISEG